MESASGADWPQQEDNALTEHFGFQPHQRIRFSLQLLSFFRLYHTCSFLLSLCVPLGSLTCRIIMFPGPLFEPLHKRIELFSRFSFFSSSFDSLLLSFQPPSTFSPSLSFHPERISSSCHRSSTSLTPSSFYFLFVFLTYSACRCRSSVDVTLRLPSDSGSRLTHDTIHRFCALFIRPFTRTGHSFEQNIVLTNDCWSTTDQNYTVKQRNRVKIFSLKCRIIDGVVNYSAAGRRSPLNNNSWFDNGEATRSKRSVSKSAPKNSASAETVHRFPAPPTRTREKPRGQLHRRTITGWHVHPVPSRLFLSPRFRVEERPGTFSRRSERVGRRHFYYRSNILVRNEHRPKGLCLLSGVLKRLL